MQSNSKLTKYQKSMLKDLRGFMPDVQFAIMGKTTIAFQHVGDNVEFATAICADTEKKNRPKVGKFYAITRFENQQTVKMPFFQFDNMLDNEESLALWA
jgi:hypothetical protein